MKSFPVVCGVLLAAAFGVSMCRLAVAQDLARESGEIDSFAIGRSLHLQTCVYSFDASGNLRPGFISQGVPESTLKFFEDDLALRELELTSEQESDVRRVAARWRESLDKIFSDDSNSKTWKQLQEAVATEELKALDKLQEILLPHQFAAAHRVNLRCLIRNHGLKAILSNDAVRESLGISKSECDRVAKAGEKLRSDIDARAKKLKRSIVERVLEPLEAEQKAKVAEYWPGFCSNDNSAIDQLQLYLEDDAQRWRKSGSSSVETMIKRPCIEVGVTGSLRETEKSWNHYRDEFAVFCDMFQRSPFPNQLDLSTDQLKFISNLIQDVIKKTSELGTELLVNPNKLQDVVLADRSAQVQNQIQTLRSDALAQIKSILRPSGWQKFEQACSRSNDRCAGPIYDMLEGELSKQLKLTEREEAAIKENAAKALDQLIEESNAIESHVISVLLESLDETSRAKFKQALGDPLKHSPARIELLRMFL